MGSFSVLLNEADGSRKLPIIIGVPEAQAIAMELEKITPPRPLTHDLFVSLAKNFEFSVEEVIITHFLEGIFYAKIVCTDGIRQKSIDARPSDGLAIALRFDAPIYTYESVMNEAAISSEDLSDESETPKGKEVKVKSSKDSSSKNLDELKSALDEAIKNEEYEKAAKLRDEIEKRN
jgi:uncharacterized protein